MGSSPLAKIRMESQLRVIEIFPDENPVDDFAKCCVALFLPDLQFIEEREEFPFYLNADEMSLCGALGPELSCGDELIRGTEKCRRWPDAARSTKTSVSICALGKRRGALQSI